jgi:hypothetical protein
MPYMFQNQTALRLIDNLKLKKLNVESILAKKRKPQL